MTNTQRTDSYSCEHLIHASRGEEEAKEEKEEEDSNIVNKLPGMPPTSSKPKKSEKSEKSKLVTQQEIQDALLILDNAKNQNTWKSLEEPFYK